MAFHDVSNYITFNFKRLTARILIIEIYVFNKLAKVISVRLSSIFSEATKQKVVECLQELDARLHEFAPPEFVNKPLTIDIGSAMQKFEEALLRAYENGFRIPKREEKREEDTSRIWLAEIEEIRRIVSENPDIYLKRDPFRYFIDRLFEAIAGREFLEEIVALIFLFFVSAYTDRPFDLAILGEAETGKTYLVDVIKGCFREGEDYIYATTLSPTAIKYMEDNAKSLIIYEYYEQKGERNVLLKAIGDKIEIRAYTTTKDAEGFTAKCYVKRFSNILFTSTMLAPQVEEEFSTRLLIVSMPTSSKYKEIISRFLLEKELWLSEKIKLLQQELREKLRLPKAKVVFPAMSVDIDPSVASPRALRVFLAVAKAIALLRWPQRIHIQLPPNEEEYQILILGELEDLLDAMRLLRKLLAIKFAVKEPRLFKIYNIIVQKVKESNAEFFYVEDARNWISQELHKSYSLSRIREFLNALAEQGLLHKEKDELDKRKNRYYLSAKSLSMKSPIDHLILDPEKLHETREYLMKLLEFYNVQVDELLIEKIEEWLESWRIIKEIKWDEKEEKYILIGREITTIKPLFTLEPKEKQYVLPGNMSPEEYLNKLAEEALREVMKNEP